jgi:hypothetical protein
VLRGGACPAPTPSSAASYDSAVQAALVSFGYLALFVPFAIYFTKGGLPDPYGTWLGLAILAGSGIVGYVVASWWAVLLPLAPWLTALILILVSPASVSTDAAERPVYGALSSRS